jgi:hypothetical protein
VRRLVGLLVASVIAALGGLFVGTGTAFAHNVVVGSDPADGSSQEAGPNKVTLRYDLPVQPQFAVVTVIGPEGGHYEDGAPQVVGSSVSANVRPLGPAGKYTVGYRVVSDDGHPVTGSFSFTLTKAGTGTPGPAPAAAGAPAKPAEAGGDDDGDMPIWPWIVGAVLLLGGGVVVALRAGAN